MLSRITSCTVGLIAAVTLGVVTDSGGLADETLPGGEGSKTAAVASAAQAAAAPPQLKRTTFVPEAEDFGEGWKRTFQPEALGGDAYDVWVQDGWLHSKRYNDKGALDWYIILARVNNTDVPQVELVEGVQTFELSYAGGRYFIRDTSYALRAVRQRKEAGDCLPRESFFPNEPQSRGYGRARGTVTLSGWETDDWFFVASGLDDERFDCVVRLNPAAKRSPGYGVQTFVEGFAYYFHGKDARIIDDGELLVAFRTLERAYEMELARERIRSNLPGSVPPAIDATAWLNTAGELSWESLKGKVVLVDFWGTWCQPCIEKLPKVQQIAAKFADRDLVVIGVHSEQSGETCAEFVEKNGITFPIAIDTGKTAEVFAISAWPTYFLIDRSGSVQLGYTSKLPDEAMIEQLLGE